LTPFFAFYHTTTDKRKEVEHESNDGRVGTDCNLSEIRTKGNAGRDGKNSSEIVGGVYAGAGAICLSEAVEND
jgi:hypothetical protein